MHCYICDAQLSEIHFNRDHGDIDPCPTCIQIINEVFGDDPVTEEEERPVGEDDWMTEDLDVY